MDAWALQSPCQAVLPAVPQEDVCKGSELKRGRQQGFLQEPNPELLRLFMSFTLPIFCLERRSRWASSARCPCQPLLPWEKAAQLEKPRARLIVKPFATPWDSQPHPGTPLSPGLTRAAAAWPRAGSQFCSVGRHSLLSQLCLLSQGQEKLGLCQGTVTKRHVATLPKCCLPGFAERVFWGSPGPNPAVLLEAGTHQTRHCKAQVGNYPVTGVFPGNIQLVGKILGSNTNFALPEKH